MSFIERKIEVEFNYGTGEKGDGPPVTTTVKDCRISMNVSIAGGIGFAQCATRIYGMSLSLMNELSKVGKLPFVYRPNTMRVKAGDDKTGLAQIFLGDVTNAWPDMQSAPEVSFVCSAASGHIQQLVPSSSRSYKGSADVAVVLQNLAAEMGVIFENNGVSVILDNPYFSGSPRVQAAKAVKQAKIEWNGIENGVLAIWPSGSARNGTIPVLNEQSGMIGYPTYTESGIIVRGIFAPTVRYGEFVKVESDITPANGQWAIVRMNHEIDCLLPGGKWFTEYTLIRPEIFGGTH